MKPVRRITASGIIITVVLTLGIASDSIFATPAVANPLADRAPLDARVKWVWGPTANQYPLFTDVWSTPAVARIFDTNDDGVINEEDEPSIIFISGKSLNQFTGLGTACNATGATPNACHTGVLRVLNGRTGKEQFSLNKAFPGSMGFAGVSVAVGDVLGSGTVQIVAVTGEGYVVLIGSASPPSSSLAVLRVSDKPIPGSGNGNFGWGGGLAIADMDGDGFPELAYGATVYSTKFNAITQRWTGSGGSGGGATQALSIFTNLDGTSGLELLAGNTAYRADGTILWRRFDLPDGFTAIADLDKDGLPDVVLIANGQLYVLDAATGATKLSATLLPGIGSGGPPTIADFDGDGKPEIGVAQAKVYSLMKPDFVHSRVSILWESPIHDSSSTTGSSAFDFDADGRAEVMYADECFLWVFDGVTGAVRYAASHTSFTATEEPIVADVDGDRHAEFVMVSNGVDSSAQGLGCLDTEGMPVKVNGVTWEPSIVPGHVYRGVAVFDHNGPVWAKTSSIWNEHTYHVSNVSDGTGSLYPFAPYGAIPRAEVPNWSLPWLNNFRQNVQAPR